MIVSILNQKGGVGKTTLSINLAHAMMKQPDSTLLVDSDPQGSARDWHAEAKGEILQMIALDRPTLDRDIENLRHSYKWIFIDGAPGLTNMAMAAVKCSDVILIPVQPSPLDLWATEDLVRLIGERIAWSGGKVKAAFIVNRQIQNTIIGKEIREILNQYSLSYGISVFKSGTYQRVIYLTSVAKGMTVIDQSDKEASKEILAIAKELREFV